MKNNQLPELPVAWESISSVLERLARSANEANKGLALRVQGMIREAFATSGRAVTEVKAGEEAQK